jgi:hypothetical protein
MVNVGPKVPEHDTMSTPQDVFGLCTTAEGG